MKEVRFEELKKSVNYLNEEGFAGENKQFIVFRNAEEAIKALRNNEIPNVPWTEEDEQKWQAAQAIENAFNISESDVLFDELETIDWTNMPKNEVERQWNALVKEEFQQNEEEDESIN